MMGLGLECVIEGCANSLPLVLALRVAVMCVMTLRVDVAKSPWLRTTLPRCSPAGSAPPPPLRAML